jgi:anti-anti-sigma factor
MDMIRTQEDSQVTFLLKGGFTFTEHVQFRTVLEAITHEKISNITIDLTEVPYIDSAGLGMLLLARDQAQQLHKTLTILRPRQQVKKMFELSQFNSLFTILE